MLLVDSPGFICHRCVHRIDGAAWSLGGHQYRHISRRDCHLFSGWLIRLRWKLARR